jgi:lysozyme
MPALHVVDLSHYNNVADFAAIKRAGVIGMIHKATEGTGYTDDKFKAREAGCKEAGIAFASYHFLKHGNINAQISHYLDFAEPPEGGRVCIDYEDAACTLDDLHQAVDAIKAADPSLQITIYGGSLLKAQLGNSHDPKLAPHSFWLAQYTAGAPSWPTGTWPVWTLWQYSDGQSGGSPRTVAGINPPVDCNTFNGSPENCLKWLSPTTAQPAPAPRPTPPPPAPSPLPAPAISIALTNVPAGIVVHVSVNGQPLV